MSVYSYAVTHQFGRLCSLLDPWAVRAAATLRLADLVSEGVNTTSALAARSNTDSHALSRLMRHLRILGLFCTTADGRWKTTELGEVLRDDHPLRMRRTLDQTNHYIRKVDESSYGLLQAVQTGGPVWNTLHGRQFWEDLATDRQLGTGFDELMDHRSASLGPAITQSYDWTTIDHVIDVGGGTGRVLANILAAHPNLHGTLVDLPNTVTGAAAVLEDANVAHRCRIAPQSFFDILPPGGDVYLLTNILHNWNDENSARILRRCVEAGGPGGRILLAERVIADKADDNEQALVSGTDLYMLLLIGGQERTKDEFHQLALSSGLTPTASYALTKQPWMSLLEYTVKSLRPR